MEEEIKLSTEDEFEITAFNMQADAMSREQAIDLLKTLFRMYRTQRRVFIQMVKIE